MNISTANRLHKSLGLILLLPFIGWILTGAVFLVKPGYEGAYERISPKTYPIEQTFNIAPGNDWQEFRVVRTTLGYHLLVNSDGQWLHLEPTTRVAQAVPEQNTLFALLDDAISINPSRYGHVVHYDGEVFRTNTGVELRLDWATLSITQRGVDTKIIGTLYKIHYLQWTGLGLMDWFLGLAGLLTLLVLVVCGIVLYLRGRRRQPD